MVSIGIDEQKGIWKICLLEDNRVLELTSFEQTAPVLTYLEQTCATYPEPIIMLSLDKSRWNAESLDNFLIAIDSINLNSYTVPPLHALPGLPAYRKLIRGNLGEAHDLCNVMTLLCRLRQREAAWQEMRFLFLEVNGLNSHVTVIEDGRIVNGMISMLLETPQNRPDADGNDEDEAFWEQVAQTLAGLLAVHHIEDIVVLGNCTDEVIAHFDGFYQFYLFPGESEEQANYEAAIGAALLAESCYAPGIAAEVAERLQVPFVQSPTFS